MPLFQTSAGKSSRPHALLVEICLIALFGSSIVKLFVFIGNMWPIIIVQVDDGVVLMTGWQSSFSKCFFYSFSLFSEFSAFNLPCLLSFRLVISFKILFYPANLFLPWFFYLFCCSLYFHSFLFEQFLIYPVGFIRLPGCTLSVDVWYEAQGAIWFAFFLLET